MPVACALKYPGRTGTGSSPRLPNELAPSGTELEDLAGVEWVEDENGDLNPARELTETEVLNLSIEQLASRGRLYQIWPMTPEGAEAFIEAADFYHVGDKARAEVARWRNPE